MTASLITMNVEVVWTVLYDNYVSPSLYELSLNQLLLLSGRDSLAALDSLAELDAPLTDSDEVAGATDTVVLSSDIDDVLPGRIWRRNWFSRFGE